MPPSLTVYVGGVDAIAKQTIQRRHFYQLQAKITHSGRYYHEYSLSIDVEHRGSGQIIEGEPEQVVTEAMRDLARWLYRSLQREYDYLSSDEAVDDSILANEFTFTQAGRRFG